MRVSRVTFSRDGAGFGELLNVLGLIGTIVEVGSAYGGHARKILSSWRGSRMYLVDIWARQSPDVYREDTSKVDYDLWFDECQKLQQQDDRVRLLRSMSVDAAGQFEDGSLDFVYIDANHDEEAVFADLLAWGPKVKGGGVLAGHDFFCRTDHGHWTQVEDALEKYFSSANYWPSSPPTVYVCPCTSWWTIVGG